MSVIVRWEVDDHYVGKARPQKTTIDEDYFEHCETKEEFMDVVNQEVQNDFDQLGFSIDDIDWGSLQVPEV